MVSLHHLSQDEACNSSRREAGRLPHCRLAHVGYAVDALVALVEHELG